MNNAVVKAADLCCLDGRLIYKVLRETLNIFRVLLSARRQKEEFSAAGEQNVAAGEQIE